MSGRNTEPPKLQVQAPETLAEQPIDATQNLDAIVTRFQRQRDKRLREQRTCEAGTGNQQAAADELREKCERLASFALDRVVVLPGSDPATHLCHQWAWAWHELRAWLTAAGLADHLAQLVPADDLALQAVLHGLSIVAERSGIGDLEVWLEEAMTEPHLIRSIRAGLRQLPDVLLRPGPEELRPAEERATVPPPRKAEVQAPATEQVTRPGRRGPRLDMYAIGIQDGKTWLILRRQDNRWRYFRKLPISKGRQASFLVAFAKGGGFLRKDDAIRLVNERPSGAEAMRLMNKIVKPTVSRLRRTIRKQLEIPDDVDPLPWQEEVRGWRGLVQIGYAALEDAQHNGAQERWRFWTGDEG